MKKEKMKFLRLLVPVLAGILLITTSCSDDEEGIANEFQDGINETDVLNAESETVVETTFEDVDVVTEAGMDNLDLIRANGRPGIRNRDEVLDCANLDFDTLNQMITIDFGDGCEGPGGRIRSGKVIIEYDGRRFEPGSFRIVSFDNYFIDGVKVEGVRTITNVSESQLENVSFEITLEGGKLTFEDSSTVTRDVRRVRTWIRAENPLQDETVISILDARGTNIDGTSYEVTLLEPLVYKRQCQLGGDFIAVEGIKEITINDDSPISMDYGDGSCDNFVDITKDGETTTVEINPRRRRFLRRNG